MLDLPTGARRPLSVFALVFLSLVAVFGCSDDPAAQGSGSHTDAEVPVSPGADTVPEGQMAVVGKVFDYVTGAPVADAFVSTFPPTLIVRTNGDGEFVLSDALSPGEIYEVKGEAQGYERRFAPVRPVPGRRATLNLPLVPSERAVPLRFEPAVLVFTSDAQEVRVTVTATGEGTLTPAFDPPAWLAVVTPPGALRAGERTRMTFRIVPEAFAAAVAESTAGETLSAEIAVTDEYQRLGLLSAVAVPAPPGLITLTANVGAVGVRLGAETDIAITARYAEQPLVGALLRAPNDTPGLAVEAPERISGDDGVAILRVRGEVEGLSELVVGVPAYPDVPPVRIEVEVLPPTGEPGPEGPCAPPNGGCGDPTLRQCVPDANGGQRCEDIDECQSDNGGCGSPTEGRCVNQPGALRTCIDLDACAPDASGGNGCGLVGFFTCVDQELLPPICDDIDECADDNGGCGDRWHHRCVNHEGMPHECLDFEPCAPDDRDETDCGPRAHVLCIDHPGAEPTCLDINECVPGTDGRNACGVATRWTCTNQDKAPPICEPIDLCAINNGNCLPAERYRCVDRVDDSPECLDVDECATNYGDCGARDLNVCTNVEGGAPICTPRDRCAPDETLMNHCGDARYTVCTGEPGTFPECADRLECAVAENGRNGCPGLARASLCIERVGAPPDCIPCPEGFVNLDADPQSCEHACVAAGAEVCNGRDDDCDGRIDDPFDLRRDPDNCGACGHRCADAPGVAEAACQSGICGALRCAPGLLDRDGDPENGCEETLPEDTLYVDAARDDPRADGTAAHPFRRIGDALTAGVALAERVISIAAGVYPECLTLDVSNTHLVGAGADQVTVACDQPYALWIFSVTNVRVSGLRAVTTDQAFGVYVQNSADVFLWDLAVVGYVHSIAFITAERVSLRGIRVVGAGGGGATSRGLALAFVNDFEVSGLEIDGVEAGANDAIGIEVGQGCEHVRLSNARISGLSVGLPSVALDLAAGVRDVQVRDVRIDGVAGADFEPGVEIPGGDAFGVRIGEGVEAIEFTDLSIAGVRGGDSGVMGGSAFGVSAARSNVLSLTRVDVGDVAAGAAGVGGVSGSAIGLRLVDATAGLVQNVLVWRVRASGVAQGEVSGVWVDGLAETPLRWLTIADIGAPDGDEASGLVIGPSQALAVDFEDSIVSGVGGRCGRVPDGARLRVGAALFHGCGEPPVEGPYAMSAEVLTEDPRFRDRARGDLRLAGDSPAMNAADRASPYENERLPNGGRGDLGRYGNTAEATPSP